MARIKEYERPAGHIAQDLCSFVSPKIIASALQAGQVLLA